jgi:hypothetical protein
MKHFGADKNCRSLPLAKIIDKYLANVNQIKRYEAGTTQPTLEVLGRKLRPPQ